MKNTILAIFVALCGVAFDVCAATVSGFSPQGEANQVRQIVIRFDQPAVAFGDGRAPDPVEVSCVMPQPIQGTGHWLNPRTWVYDFAQELPAGVTCDARLRTGAAGFLGGGLRGDAHYAFNTGAPTILSTQPDEGASIAEDQIFVLNLSGPASPQSLRSRVWCAVEGLGERVPVRQIEGADRATVIRLSGLEKEASSDPLRVVTLACNRKLPASAKVQLVYGAGVASAGPQSGALRTAADRRLDFQVRAPFTAELRCQRENARSGCIPILPIRLAFSAPVPVALLQGISLKSGSKNSPAVIEQDFDGQQNQTTAMAVSFAPPFDEKAAFAIHIPTGLRDDSDRPLSNAGNFPLSVRTSAMPVLAKFAAAPFGVIERLSEPQGVGVLPLTLRNLQPQLDLRNLPVPAARGQVEDLRLDADPEIIAWYRKVRLYDNFLIERSRARQDVPSALPPDAPGSENFVETRALSLLSGLPAASRIALPDKVEGDLRPFEVIGVPLSPGFHVVELASDKLGEALLDERYGAQRRMFVRTSVLVTNLAVHFKLGRENSVAWVTTLDQGQPVAGAMVRVSDCQGRPVAQGTTDASGIASFKGISPQAPTCMGDGGYSQAYFVSARARQPKAETGIGTLEDLAFTWTDWDRGIEPWRFNVPTSRAAQADILAHTVLDRSLLRAGDTLAMKHILRAQTSRGFGRVDPPPTRLVITHVGSGQKFESDLTWYETATGGQSSESRFTLPVAAKLGQYQIALAGDTGEIAETGAFRVEEFRLPILRGQVRPAMPGALVRASSLPVDVQVQFVAGGPAAGLPVQVSAVVRDRQIAFPAGEGFVFSGPRQDRADSADGRQEGADDQAQQMVANRLPLTLDRLGGGKLTIGQLPVSDIPRELLLEATYPDPNGEIQTIRSAQTLWPATVIAGIKAEGWVSVGKKLNVQALALDTDGKPRADVSLTVSAVAHRIESTRKRMVGGFYSYENRSVSTDLGSMCAGKSDAQGMFACEAALGQAGEVELIVTATDASGHRSQAATSVFVTRQGEMWFGGADSDRMDVLAERKTYQPGEIAKLQVRMPFREATALVAIEREGILETQVVTLTGQDPTLSLKVQPDWGPNVYVSVLALRGRLQVVPWYSFFTWGYRSPVRWWSAFNSPDNRQGPAPTALVDLSKPTFRFGMATLRVGDAAHRLNVKVETDKTTYPVRGTAQVTVAVTQPGGQPAARAEIALAAVDKALLELMPNRSWNLLEAMLGQRAWGVTTATAQMEIVGRRHYGRKAVPAGGGGGGSATRELFDTLLLWNGRIALDDQGRAKVTVPLNDALTTFQIVAVADMSTGLFGTGTASIQSTQDVQIISGLPPLVREQDRYTAQFTLRNTTAAAMNLKVTARSGGVDLAAQSVAIPANESRQVSWDVIAPAQVAAPGSAQTIVWEIGAKDEASGAQDAIKVTQRLVPVVPVTVRQATLVQLAQPLTLPVQAPAGALAGKGGLKLSLEASLAQGLPGVRTWLANYPFSCLEQTASKALGLQDAGQWSQVQQQMSGYLDADGLANYFPVRAGDGNQGSDALTAYLLAAAHATQKSDPRFALNPPLTQQMLAGLAAFVEGRIERSFWSPRPDLEVRKLAAIEALSRYGQAVPAMLDSIVIDPKRWPTHAVIDWLNILKRVPTIPRRESLMAQASQILRERLIYEGTRVMFNNERDDQWWWLMQNGDVNAARLLLAVLDDPKWRDDLAGLATGLLGRQQRGAWSTTTANVWGSLAMRAFAAARESVPVSGSTVATLGATQATTDLSTKGDHALWLSWPATGGVEPLSVAHQGAGKPWLTVQSMAAVPLETPRFSGYRIRRTIEPVQQADKSLAAGSYSRGDILRVTLEVNAAADMTWVVVTDPIPAGASILGGGLGRDSAIAAQGERDPGEAWPAYQARSFESFTAYYAYVPSGVVKVQYTMRLNNAGTFALPPTRVEAMYAPEIFGEAPNPSIRVQ